MRESSALVTGGAGFIGSHLVDALVADGVQVTVLDDLSSGDRRWPSSHGDRVRFIEGDVRDASVCATAVEGADVVYHLASRVSVVESVAEPELYRAVVLEGTQRMLDAAVAAGVRRLVLASSCSVYGDAPPPVAESAPIDPQSPYAAMKFAAEEACRAASRDGRIETVCPRFFNVHGPRQRADSPYSGVIAIFSAKAAAGESPMIFGDGGQTRDFIHVSDIVRGLRLAMAEPTLGHGEPINLGTGVGTTVLELAKILGCPDPIFAPAREGEIRHSRADGTLAHTTLGFSPSGRLHRGPDLG
ncbi:MAG: hypothetical protein RLZZ461_1066 [Planctomycetota bacterium]|jgi:UDP-glucose 4-epimerase